MNLTARFWLPLAAVLLVGDPAHAAEPALNRYDLGQRLVALERAWDATPDAAARARAMPVLKLAVPQLLAGKEEEAAATLDRARLLLRSAEPTAAERWAASLTVHPSARLLDPARGPLTLHISSAYAVGDVPDTVLIRVMLFTADGKTAVAAKAVALTALPTSIPLVTDTLPEGDYTLRTEVLVGDKLLATYGASISLVARLRERLERLSALPARWSLDLATLDSLNALLRSLAGGFAPETNYPAARLLAEADELNKAVTAGIRFYSPQRTGQFWLSIPTGAVSTLARLFVPDAAKNGKPLPLVVALHGAGGSENLFFEAYGYGMIARLAQERGWLVVAPRAGWLFDGPPPVPAMIDELAKIYPVDKQRIYLVGHSMGAMQAVTLAQESPGRYAAIAVLGAGGSVTKPAAFRDLPVFIGCGREDFLLGGAKGLAASLKKAVATRVTYKEYPGVEHLLIVQEALPEVFKFFSTAVSDGSQNRR
jgi:predicted esterase